MMGYISYILWVAASLPCWPAIYSINSTRPHHTHTHTHTHTHIYYYKQRTEQQPRSTATGRSRGGAPSLGPRATHIYIRDGVLNAIPAAVYIYIYIPDYGIYVPITTTECDDGSAITKCRMQSWEKCWPLYDFVGQRHIIIISSPSLLHALELCTYSALLSESTAA